jgi:hypothetical protein
LLRVTGMQKGNRPVSDLVITSWKFERNICLVAPVCYDATRARKEAARPIDQKNKIDQTVEEYCDNDVVITTLVR